MMCKKSENRERRSERGAPTSRRIPLLLMLVLRVRFGSKARLVRLDLEQVDGFYKRDPASVLPRIRVTGLRG